MLLFLLIGFIKCIVFLLLGVLVCFRVILKLLLDCCCSFRIFVILELIGFIFGSFKVIFVFFNDFLVGERIDDKEVVKFKFLGGKIILGVLKFLGILV